MASKKEVLTLLLTEIGTNDNDFTRLFAKGCELLELDDAGAAVAFDTSVPNVVRWKQGTVPPTAALVLRQLRERIEAKLRGPSAGPPRA